MSNGTTLVILSEAKDLDPEENCQYEILRFTQDDKIGASLPLVVDEQRELNLQKAASKKFDH